MLSGIAGDPMQQVVLCFDWCALGWMFPSMSLQPPSSRVELESWMHRKVPVQFGRGERPRGPTYPYFVQKSLIEYERSKIRLMKSFK